MAAELEVTTGEVVAAALGADIVDEGTAREAVPTDTAHRAPSARLRVPAPITARSRLWQDVASSAACLSELSVTEDRVNVTEDRVKLVSYDLACADRSGSS